MYKFIKKIKIFAAAHKITSAVIIFALIGLGYWFFKSFTNDSENVRYVSAQVQKGTLSVSVSGSGQVSASNQIDIKAKASGDLVYIGVENGQEIKMGSLIAQLDARDAQKSVRDAETNLESAKLSLEKLKKPADALSVLQAENALVQAQESKQKAENDLNKAYDDGFNTISNAFLDLPTVMSDLENILYKNTISQSQWNIDWYASQTSPWESEKTTLYKNDVNRAYTSARQLYNKNFDNYKSVSRNSDTKILEPLILETYDTTKIIADAIKTSSNFIDFAKDVMTRYGIVAPSAVTTHQSSLSTYTSKTNSHLLSLLTIKQSIKDSQTAVINAERTIAEKTESLAELKAGADALDIQAQELVIKQKENALLDAKEKLADYSVRAPFEGVIAAIDVKKGDSASASTVIATLITKQRLAEVSLNEVDMAKVKVGQKAAIAFDAIEGLSITGEVAEIDSMGTVSQGVVTYGVKISFDTQDERVKPGMSVSSSIITDVRQDVLLVPNSAVKQLNDTTYVEIFIKENQTPERQIIQTGLSNDTMTEIVNGLNEGDKVVTQTITADSAQNQTQKSANMRIPGIGGGGMGR
jgi:RND family efflux transporter MFP subunit